MTTKYFPPSGTATSALTWCDLKPGEFFVFAGWAPEQSHLFVRTSNGFMKVARASVSGDYIPAFVEQTVGEEYSHVRKVDVAISAGFAD